MKILFNCYVPFSLAHGGAQVQIEQTQAALQRLGVAVEPLRWWDGSQTGDVLQHFGRVPITILRMAQQKGVKVVMADLLTAVGSRSHSRLRFQRLAIRLARLGLPASLHRVTGWESYLHADAYVALTPWEAHLMHYLYGAPAQRIHVVPNGVEEVFFQSQPAERGPWLVCTATITARKRVLELAQAAVQAQTPLWVIGKPYDGTEPCAKDFLELAKAHPQQVRFEGPIADRTELAKVYRSARGFVLLSTMESLSLSALEAAACGCPLLLSDLPWARSVFKDSVKYCLVDGSTTATAACLRQFYDAAPTLAAPPKPLSWLEVAQELKRVYDRIISPASGSALP